MVELGTLYRIKKEKSTVGLFILAAVYKPIGVDGVIINLVDVVNGMRISDGTLVSDVNQITEDDLKKINVFDYKLIRLGKITNLEYK